MNHTKTKYKVIGLMSGTSLDGLDIAFCEFTKLASGWKYAIEKFTTLRYPASWQKRLSQAHTLGAREFMELDAAYGTYLGATAKKFVTLYGLRVDFISSHGHTVFHQPDKGFTTQIGSGHSLHAASGLPVVCDFRSMDVALGGEGAPLVPAGDKFLFHQYDVCLNLGGIANLSLDEKGKRHAFDVCFCNMGLNFLAAQVSEKFDKNGGMAAQGEVNDKLLLALSKVYSKFRNKRPSLGRELFEKNIAGLLSGTAIPVEDRLRTFTESAAMEICSAILARKLKARVLCTGGGAFNGFLIARMLELGGDDLTFIIPDDEIIKFKEAMVFGFLGVLRLRNEINCLKTVTHASRDTSSGILIGFK